LIISDYKHYWIGATHFLHCQTECIYRSWWRAFYRIYCSDGRRRWWL